MAISYLHDTLKDLSSAVLTILRGAAEVKVIFMDEPGEHLLRIRRVDEPIVSLEVWWFNGWQSWGMATSEPILRLSCVTRLAHLRGQVLSALESIWQNHGAAGYLEKWCEHEFPIEEFRQLQAN